MDFDRYKAVLTDFDVLIDYGIRISNLLHGTIVLERHRSYSDPIFNKILCHAITLRKISPQLNDQPEHELWDISSACSIARCIIEAHDVLGYLALNNCSAEENEFRVLVCELHDQQHRHKMLNTIGSTDPIVQEIEAEKSRLMHLVISHSCYEGLSKERKKKIDNNEAPFLIMSKRELNEANSVNHLYHQTAMAWLSQHIHALPMSLHQLFSFKAGTPGALQVCSMPIQYATGFLAKSIVEMAEAFPQGNMKVDKLHEQIFNNWCGIVRHGTNLAEI